MPLTAPEKVWRLDPALTDEDEEEGADEVVLEAVDCYKDSQWRFSERKRRRPTEETMRTGLLALATAVEAAPLEASEEGRHWE
jgi:hypothetical protein